MLKLKKVRRFTKYNNNKIDWVKAEDIKQTVERLILKLNLYWIKKERLFYFRSTNSKSKAIARIWGLPRLWQDTLKIKPAYIIEVIEEKFNKQKKSEQENTLLHELAHIPKNFSGALVPHYRRGNQKFQDKVNKFVRDNKLKEIFLKKIRL